MSGPSRALVYEEWVHGGFWAWSDVHGKYVSEAFPEGVEGVEPRFGDPVPPPPPPFASTRTPAEEADEILAGETVESLPYAILRAGGRMAEAHGQNRQDEERYWASVVGILRRRAKSGNLPGNQP